MFHLHQESDDITTLLTSEAVIETASGSHMEGRGFLIMEGTETFPLPAACALELDVVTDHIFNARLFADMCDIALSNPAGHRLILCLDGGNS